MEHSYFNFYSMIFFQRIKVYRVEIIDIGRGNRWDSTRDYQKIFFGTKKILPWACQTDIFQSSTRSRFQPQFVKLRLVFNSSFQEEMLLPCWIACKSAQTNHPFPLLSDLFERIFEWMGAAQVINK